MTDPKDQRITELERELVEARAEVDAQKEAVDCRDRALDAANTTLARAEAEAAALYQLLADARLWLGTSPGWGDGNLKQFRDVKARIDAALSTTTTTTTTAGAALLAERERLRGALNRIALLAKGSSSMAVDIRAKVRAALSGTRAEGEDTP